MKFRVKYRVTEAGRFLGHLDMTRTIMKTLRRAQIPVMLTEGFNPHPKLSFAMPLSVGHTAAGEYFEVVLAEPMEGEMLKTRFNQYAPPAIVIEAVREMQGPQDSMSSQIGAAFYTLTFPDKAALDSLGSALEEVEKAEKILIMKKTKSKRTETDIKPLIFRLHLTEQAEGLVLQATISHGSQANLKIGDLLLVLERFGAHIHQARIERTALLIKEGDTYRDLLDF